MSWPTAEHGALSLVLLLANAFSSNARELLEGRGCWWKTQHWSCGSTELGPQVHPSWALLLPRRHVPTLAFHLRKRNMSDFFAFLGDARVSCSCFFPWSLISVWPVRFHWRWVGGMGVSEPDTRLAAEQKFSGLKEEVLWDITGC